LQKRRIGKSAIEVSVIGLGTVKFGRNQGVSYPTSFALPTDNEIETLLHCATELGINLLDTAPAYGTSEERLGKLLQANRHDWIISTKVGEEFVDGESRFDFSPEAIRHSIERSLKRLRTDYLDIVFVHSNGDDLYLIEEETIFLVLEAYKKAGKIRAYGMSTKTIAGGLLTVDKSDLAMVTFNPVYTAEREVITHAHQHQKGVFIKKAFASGHLQTGTEDAVGDAMRYIFAEPGVTSVIVGTINPAHLQQNVTSAIKALCF
jgi:aryl-alcohol dehydrogenase-like predicted oxidoreductase